MITSDINKKINEIINKYKGQYIENEFDLNRNKKDILDKIYYVDEFGIEYWHGEHEELKEATKEEQEEMEKMLESFKEMEEDIN